MNAMDISVSALNVEWQRINIIAENIANINTTRGADGKAFSPKRLVAGPAISFDKYMTSETVSAPAKIEVLAIEEIPNSIRLAFEPDHPHADENGMVSYPKIDYAAEMSLMIRASRVYEANLVSMSIAQQMYSRALELGRR